MKGMFGKVMLLFNFENMISKRLFVKHLYLATNIYQQFTHLWLK